MDMCIYIYAKAYAYILRLCEIKKNDSFCTYVTVIVRRKYFEFQ